MQIKVLAQEFSICKLQDWSQIPFGDEFVFVGKTDDELSVVCYSESVPQECISLDKGWNALKIQGMLDFSMVGVLSKLSTILAQEEISVFVVSTFNTDYILVKQERLMAAIQALKSKGYSFIEEK